MKKHVWRPLFHRGLGGSYSWCLSPPPSPSFHFSCTSYFGDSGTLKSTRVFFFFLSVNSFVHLCRELTFLNYSGDSKTMWMFGLSDFATCLVSAVCLSFRCYLSCTLFPKRMQRGWASGVLPHLRWKGPRSPGLGDDGETTGQFGMRGKLRKLVISFPTPLPIFLLSCPTFGVSQDLGEACSRKMWAVRKGRASSQRGRARLSLHASFPLVLTAELLSSKPSPWLSLAFPSKESQPGLHLRFSDLPLHQILDSSSIQDFVKGASNPKSLMFGLCRSVWESELGVLGAVIFTGSNPLHMVIHSSCWVTLIRSFFLPRILLFTRCTRGWWRIFIRQGYTGCILTPKVNQSFFLEHDYFHEWDTTFMSFCLQP